MTAIWRDAFARLMADDDLRVEIMESDHPAARRLARWLCHDVLPAIDMLGLRGPPGAGEYDWPGTAAEFEAIVTAAVNAVRPVQ